MSPELPGLVLREWSYRHRRQFWYALITTLIGGVIALSLIGGYIYLVMQGHPKAAGYLLGSGALSMVSGFLAARFL